MNSEIHLPRCPSVGIKDMCYHIWLDLFVLFLLYVSVCVNICHLCVGFLGKAEGGV